MIRFFLLAAACLFASYQDDELDRLWSQISDINNPSLEDYQLIDQYLAFGKRPYLETLRKSKVFYIYGSRMKNIDNFRLVAPGGRPPLFQQISFNVTPATEKRCILLYSSSNGIYPLKAQIILGEIKNSGYSGHVLLRIGGFPNTANGGLKICHVPYSFKVAFLQEARLLGFKEILWVDLAIHPLFGFDTIFDEIEKKGYFFTAVGSLEQNNSSHLPAAAESLGIHPDLYPRIYHISSAILGLNMNHPKAIQLLEGWYRGDRERDPQHHLVARRAEPLCHGVGRRLRSLLLFGRFRLHGERTIPTRKATYRPVFLRRQEITHEVLRTAFLPRCTRLPI